MKTIKISDEAYQVVNALAKETKLNISDVASTLIINKDNQIQMGEKVVKTLEVKVTR